MVRYRQRSRKGVLEGGHHPVNKKARNKVERDQEELT